MVSILQTNIHSEYHNTDKMICIVHHLIHQMIHKTPIQATKNSYWTIMTGADPARCFRKVDYQIIQNIIKLHNLISPNLLTNLSTLPNFYFTFDQKDHSRKWYLLSSKKQGTAINIPAVKHMLSLPRKSSSYEFLVIWNMKICYINFAGYPRASKLVKLLVQQKITLPFILMR